MAFVDRCQKITLDIEKRNSKQAHSLFGGGIVRVCEVFIAANAVRRIGVFAVGLWRDPRSFVAT